MNHVLAKKCQYILSDLEYRTYFHQWSCLPEENDVIHARKAQEILSDVCLSFIYIYIKQAGLEGTHQGCPGAWGHCPNPSKLIFRTHLFDIIAAFPIIFSPSIILNI